MAKSIEEVLSRQSGVIARRQALAAELTDNDVRRLLRRRDWVQLHPGVYLNHTGQPTWLQRAWAGVQFAWPAALCADSALRATEGPGKRGRDDATIHVSVDRHRHLASAPGIQVHRLSRINTRVQWNLGPPRLRYEEAALDVAIDAANELAAINVIAEACQSRCTTADRMMTALVARPWAPRREWLTNVLTDVSGGTCSVLEHGYLHRVEQPHGLPHAARQVCAAASVGVVYRDAEYDCGLIVELDGRLFHNTARAREADFDRDLDAAVDGRESVRISWGQVFDRACRTAARLDVLLQKRGWTGAAYPCGPDCAVGA